jgi:hypothetical protein
MTALHSAVNENRKEVASLLLSRGADLELEDDVRMYSECIYVCSVDVDLCVHVYMYTCMCVYVSSRPHVADTMLHVDSDITVSIGGAYSPSLRCSQSE